MLTLAKLLKFSPDLICTMNREGKFIAVSDAAFDMLGYQPEELIHRSYTDFIDPADLPAAADALNEVMTGKELHIQNRYLHKSGGIVPLRWSGGWDNEEGILYAIARNGQITEREEAMRVSLEESNRRYQYVSKATSDAIWDWDILNGTLYWGDNFETIFGYDLARLSPGIESWTAHIHPDDSGAILDSIYRVINGDQTNWKEEYRYQRADGSYADVVDRGFVIRDSSGKAIRMVGAMHDISERRKGLREMKRITDDLYKNNRELHEFGYIVSHNLRSPVANIMGIANLLELEKDDEETIAYCTINLKNSITRLDEVIKDLSKILSSTDSSVELTSERVDLGELVRNIETDLADKIMKNQARVTVTPGSFLVNSHKAYLYSIFFNLISNSLKYRSEDTPVIAIIIMEEPDSLTITFTDNGCGIDLDRHGEELFKPYKRFHSHVEGKGLGMFLVKSHVEALGGEISVKSAPGQGSCFTVVLPKGNALRV